MNLSGHPITIVSHPRSGTHLTIDFIRRQFSACQIKKWPWERFDCCYLPLEALLLNQASRNKKLQNLARRVQKPLIKVHGYSISSVRTNYPEWADWAIDRGTKIYIARNPLTMFPSLHVYFSGFSPHTRVPFIEFLKQPFATASDRVSFWSQEVMYWKEQKNVLLLRFEDIIKDTDLLLNRIASHIDEEPLKIAPLLPAPATSINRMRVTRFFSRNPESTAILGNTKWQRKLKPQHQSTDEIRDFIVSKGKNAMEALGYSM